MATSAATAPSSGDLHEGPKVNIPNLPESVLDEVYQAAGLDVSYSDIRDVKEMPEKDRLDYLKRQKNAHKLAEEIVLKELAPFRRNIDVTVRPTKHAADQMYAVVTFKKWYDLEAKETIESGGIIPVENFSTTKEKLSCARANEILAPGEEELTFLPQVLYWVNLRVLRRYSTPMKMCDRRWSPDRDGENEALGISGSACIKGTVENAKRHALCRSCQPSFMPIPKCSMHERRDAERSKQREKRERDLRLRRKLKRRVREEDRKKKKKKKFS